MNIENYKPDEFVEEFDPELENFDEPNDQFGSAQEEDQEKDLDVIDLQKSENDEELAAFDESTVDEDAEEITESDEVEGDSNDDYDNEGNDYFN